MSGSKQAKNDPNLRPIPPLGEAGSQQIRILSTGKIPRKLSQETMRLLLDRVREGERNLARNIICLTLNVNDVVAEYCLRHLEQKLRDDPHYTEELINQVNVLAEADQKDQLIFLRYAFGVQGMVSTAILNHYRSFVPLS